MNWENKPFLLTSDKNRVDINTVHAMLRRSHWAGDRSREEIVTSVENSLCFSLFNGSEQIGFTRVLTDGMAYAILLDMVIQEDYRGRGLGQWMVQCICAHPKIAPLRQVLWTSTAEDFYRQAGFEEMPKLKFMARGWEMTP